MKVGADPSKRGHRPLALWWYSQGPGWEDRAHKNGNVEGEIFSNLSSERRTYVMGWKGAVENRMR